jgi:hypothetical protein
VRRGEAGLVFRLNRETWMVEARVEEGRDASPVAVKAARDAHYLFDLGVRALLEKAAEEAGVKKSRKKKRKL